MLAPFSLMCVKMIVSMVVSEVDAGRALVPVQIVAIVPTASAGKLSDDVPAHVMLPRYYLVVGYCCLVVQSCKLILLFWFCRALWTFLGFVLTPRADTGAEHASAEFEEELQKKVQILGRICTALYEEVVWESEAVTEGSSAEDNILVELRAVYDALCVAAMSRLVQITRLRSSLAAFMLNLPAVPSACIGILKLLISTGSKGAAPPPGARSSAAAAEAARNRGTRTESLMLLGQMVFSVDEAAGRAALNHLLRSCVSEDFELRTKVVNLIVQ